VQLLKKIGATSFEKVMFSLATSLVLFALLEVRVNKHAQVKATSAAQTKKILLISQRLL
jgi:hypothetical protein